MDFEHSDEIANLFKMFSDKTRVNILLCLKEKRECSVDEISELLGMEQSAISHQLRILRQGKTCKAEKMKEDILFIHLMTSMWSSY